MKHFYIRVFRAVSILMKLNYLYLGRIFVIFCEFRSVWNFYSSQRLFISVLRTFFQSFTIRVSNKTHLKVSFSISDLVSQPEPTWIYNFYSQNSPSRTDDTLDVLKRIFQISETFSISGVYIENRFSLHSLLVEMAGTLPSKYRSRKRPNFHALFIPSLPSAQEQKWRWRHLETFILSNRKYLGNWNYNWNRAE